MQRRFHGILASLLVIGSMLAACGPSTPDLPGAPAGDAGPVQEDLCDQTPELRIFQFEPAGRVATLGASFDFGTLGETGARALALDLLSLEGSFCSAEIPASAADALEEIDRLYRTGQDGPADEKLGELLAEVRQDALSREDRTKAAAQRMQQGGGQARKAVRTYLNIAARAQFWGNDERADEAVSQATEIYQAWASEAVDEATLKEALTIAAEAQLLGLFDLGDEAIARATALAEADYVLSLEEFQPCLASEQDAQHLLKKTAAAMLLGVVVDENDYMGKLEEWKQIQLRRQRGEAVPECDAWQLMLSLDHTWESGNYSIAWEGFFTILEDGNLDGQGTGSLASHVEVTCIDLMSGNEFLSTTDASGSFSFEIEGVQETRDDGPVFRFLLPAEVEVSGVDTCNPFDETTFLPKFVIEEIHTSGGIEGYDINTDQIYLIVPAVDGGSANFESLIGPLTVTVEKSDRAQ
jgi:hypothetical protein